MKQLIQAIIVGLCLLSPARAADSGAIQIHEGENILSLILRNDTAVPVGQLSLAAEASSLPAWITISPLTLTLSPSETEHAISIPLTVVNAPEDGHSTIQLLITDEQGRSWTVQLVVSVTAAMPDRYALLPNFPNPFNPETTIRYTLAGSGPEETTLIIYNALGQEVRTLVNAEQSSGAYTVNWNGRDNAGNPVPSGVYLCRLKSGSFNEVRRMMLVK